MQLSVLIKYGKFNFNNKLKFYVVKQFSIFRVFDMFKTTHNFDQNFITNVFHV